MKLKDILNEGKYSKDEINDKLKNIKSPSDLAELQIEMWNNNQSEKFHKIFFHMAGTNKKVYDEMFKGLKKILSKYPDGIL